MRGSICCFSIRFLIALLMVTLGCLLLDAEHSPSSAEGEDLANAPVKEDEKVYSTLYGTVRRTTIEERLKKCTCPEGARGLLAADLGSNISVGASVTAQLIRYNITSGKASVNTPGLGAGIAFRYYPDSWMAEIDGRHDIRRIKPDCRATTFDAPTLEEDPEKGKIAFPLFSISPTVFLSKSEGSSDLSVQPTLVIGLFRDLISLGVGFNLTEPDAGDVFILFGIGAGFKF